MASATGWQTMLGTAFAFVYSYDTPNHSECFRAIVRILHFTADSVFEPFWTHASLEDGVSIWVDADEHCQEPFPVPMLFSQASFIITLHHSNSNCRLANSMAVEEAQGRLRALPPPFNQSSESFELITQGAEALVYKTTFLDPSTPAALKVRPQKPWRHPTLDKRLTRQRILAESRVLVKCRKDGVSVPGILAVDWENGWTVTEWIDGKTVKQAIRERHTGEEKALTELLGRIGRCVGKLHAAGVIHGDLTSSNMMLRAASGSDASGGEHLQGDVVLIDFGLATQATQEEDRAVDLYVLERAFGSTHPKEEALFEEVLKAYGESYKGAKMTLRRLEDVRMRGRKKSMIG